MSDTKSAGPEADAFADAVNAAKMATLGRLVAGIAHELNTPLGALNSNHDVLKRALGRLQDILADEVVDETELSEVRRIVAALGDILKVNDLAVDRMVGLVNSLRTFGRPDRAGIDRIDVHESIDAALALLAHELRDRVEVRREYGELPEIECYAQEIGQVFMNLLLNAVQATAGDGVITVRTRARVDGIEVAISDTGTGIPPESLPLIMEPGFTTRGKRMGMGLGLLTATRIVERHRGRIEVESRVGEGSTFTVTLPARLEAGGNP
ncbi:MAG: ATP-binding protein [Gemmatimonadota bacterium]